MYQDLNGKCALITGAGKRAGIGFAIARKLAACGANVILADFVNRADEDNPLITATQAELKSLADSLADRFSVKALSVDVDVTHADSIHLMVDTLSQHVEQIHILCNNAGTVLGVPNAIHSYDDDA